MGRENEGGGELNLNLTTEGTNYLQGVGGVKEDTGEIRGEYGFCK